MRKSKDEGLYLVLRHKQQHNAFFGCSILLKSRKTLRKKRKFITRHETRKFVADMKVENELPIWLKNLA
jgi:hypothetical protein